MAQHCQEKCKESSHCLRSIASDARPPLGRSAPLTHFTRIPTPQSQLTAIFPPFSATIRAHQTPFIAPQGRETRAARSKQAFHTPFHHTKTPVSQQIQHSNYTAPQFKPFGHAAPPFFHPNDDSSEQNAPSGDDNDNTMRIKPHQGHKNAGIRTIGNSAQCFSIAFRAQFKASIPMRLLGSLKNDPTPSFESVSGSRIQGPLLWHIPHLWIHVGGG